MKTKLTFITGAALLALLTTFNLQPLTANAQGTAFTYQGRLQDSGAPANGIYDLRFALVSTGSGTAVLYGFVTNSAVAVTNGLFTVPLDFGPNFPGEDRWLGIAVRTNGAATFIPLTPRQQLTPVPYAIDAANVSGLSIQQNSDGDPNVILGSSENSIPNGVEGGTIGGGIENTVGANSATVAGGGGNSASGYDATVAGGVQNTASGIGATVSGGDDNTASAGEATVAGGGNNLASGFDAIVAGGVFNTASGIRSFAAGTQAQALNDGAFVWADSNEANFSSTNNDSFNVRAAGGARFETSGTGMTVDGSLTIAGVSQYNSGLKVTGSSTGGTGMAIENTASGGHKYDLISGGAGSSEGAGAFELFDESVANGFRLTITTNGNVGIGTTTPTTALQVNGVVTATSFVGAIAPTDLPGGLGGSGNTVTGPQATVAGGLANAATNNYATVSGGTGNIAGGYASTVAGGDNNTATGTAATVSGDHNTASGLYSFAAGHLANATNDGAFVWADSTVGNFASTNNNSFNVRAAGGARFVTFGKGMTVDGTVVANGVALTSDRNAKENFTAVNAQSVLAKVAALPVTEWNYKTDNQGVQHIGPMAQDFQAAFGLDGKDDRHISVIDEGGVALAAIQGLNQKLEKENAELKLRLEVLEKIVLNKK